MAATRSPSTDTDAELTRCTRALTGGHRTLSSRVAAVDVIDSYLSALSGDWRRLAHGEWGLTLPPEAAGGWPLEMGLRIADELLRVQAFAAPADEAYDPWGFLFVNRSTRLVRFACTGSGDIWVHGDVPVAAVDERMVDRLLGLVVEAVVIARGYAASARGEQPPAADGGGWLTPR